MLRLMTMKAVHAVAFVVVAGLSMAFLLRAAGFGPGNVVCQLNSVGDSCAAPTDYGALVTQWALLSVPGAAVAVLILITMWASRRPAAGRA